MFQCFYCIHVMFVQNVVLKNQENNGGAMTQTMYAHVNKWI
jgi:hypothetical protein